MSSNGGGEGHGTSVLDQLLPAMEEASSQSINSSVPLLDNKTVQSTFDNFRRKKMEKDLTVIALVYAISIISLFIETKFA
jgi:hypothetical protein